MPDTLIITQTPPASIALAPGPGPQGAVGAAGAGVQAPTGVDTSLMAVGQAARIARGGVAVPTDSQSARACASPWIMTAAGLMGPGAYVPNAQFTTAGGKPYVGQKCWLASYADDGATGAGKFTAKRPTRHVPPSFLIDNNNNRFAEPAEVVECFQVTDTSNYDSAKTCAGIFLGSQRRDIPPDEEWAAISLRGFTSANYLSHASPSTHNTLHDQESLLILFERHNVWPGGTTTLIGAPNATRTSGWVVLEDASGLHLYQFGYSFAFAIGELDFTKTVRGWNCLVVSCDKGILYGALNGHAGSFQFNNTNGVSGNPQEYLPNAPAGTVSAATNASPIVLTVSSGHNFRTGDFMFVEEIGGNTAANGIWQIDVSGNSLSLRGSTGNGAYTSGGRVFKMNGADTIVDPDSGAPLSLGYSAYATANSPFGISHAIKMTRKLSPSECVQISDMVNRTGNRMQFPDAIAQDPGIQWQFNPSIDATAAYTAYTDQGNGSLVFTWTSHGALTSTPITERLTWDLAPLYQATTPVVYDCNGIPRASPSAQIKRTFGPTQQDCVVVCWMEDWDASDQINPFSVWIDGTYGPAYHVRPRQAPYTFRVAIDPDTGAAGNHTVEFRNGNPTGAALDGNLGYHGGYLVGIQWGGQQATTSPVAASHALVICGPAEYDGNNVEGPLGTSPQNSGLITFLRQTYETAYGGGPNLVMSDCRLIMALHDLYLAGHGDMRIAAKHIVEMATREGASVCDILLPFGYHDYNRALWSPTAFGAAFGSLVDALNAEFGSITHTIRPLLPIQTAFDAVANSLGFTCGQYRSAISALPGAGHTCTVGDPTGPNAITWGSNPGNPNVYEDKNGTIALAANIRAIVGW